MSIAYVVYRNDDLRPIYREFVKPWAQVVRERRDHNRKRARVARASRKANRSKA